MGKEALYKCEQLNNMKMILDFMEVLWETIDVPPLHVTIGDYIDLRFTVAVADLRILKDVVDPESDIEILEGGIWMHQPKLTPKIKFPSMEKFSWSIYQARNEESHKDTYKSVLKK